MRIVIIGSGNIAHFFTPRLLANGHDVIQIYSPNIENAKLLAETHAIENYTNNIVEIDSNADAYILAVRDDALHSLNETLNFGDKSVIHCAGAVPLEAISNISSNIA